MSLKLIVMGVGGVGKSALTGRFVRGRWIAKYDPTIEESYVKSHVVDGNTYQIEILDTAGQEMYSSLRETFINSGDGFLLVYSILDDQTFDDLRDIYEQIMEGGRNRSVPIIILGNKADMASTHRAVSEEEGMVLARKWRAKFLEVSAKSNFRVQEAFESLIRTIVKAGHTVKKKKIRGVFGDESRAFDDTVDESDRRKSRAGGRRESKSPSRPTSPTTAATPESGEKKKKRPMCSIL
jgi:small GTP-binding protein